ncbi:MAG: hypothetical protein JST16_06385 [Bdellovibrionales bacterium]|nr:hypothetical protein [Bdellovibrionales bacterium]
MSNVISFEQLKRKHDETRMFTRWVEFYNGQTHEDVLEALVFEHENNFPLRASGDIIDQLRHKALIHVLQERAQTEFLRSFLDEIKKQSNN